MNTTETVFHEHLRILQKKEGYRFSIDAPILAYGVCLEKASQAVDLGTGSGVVALILAMRYPGVHIYGIEIQKDLAELAKKNVWRNKMDDRITIVHGDMKDAPRLLGNEGADVVFSNPPYTRMKTGRTSPCGERAAAKHEIHMTLVDVLSSAERLLKPSGRLVLIYSAARMADLITQMRAFKLEPKKLQIIHPKAGSHAERMLIEGVKYGRPGVRVLCPLVIHTADGSYTETAKKIIHGS
jgi:tRNA1Val (adenine37-N6)-methyltransferase